MNSQQQERHILVINGLRGRQPIALEAAAYSLGRDITNAIVLDFETVSRQHAILLRVPVPGTSEYRYRLVDGNADGKPSTNGTFVNGKRTASHELKHGDIVLFGRKVKASYLMVSMADTEFSQYLESIAFQSIKSRSLSPKETLAGAEMSGELLARLNADLAVRELVPTGSVSAIITEPALPHKDTVSGQEETPAIPDALPIAKDTVHEKENAPDWKRWVWPVAVGGAIALTGIGSSLFLNSSQPNSNPSRPVPSQAQE